jgi:Secretion system C-terminal sorting domain
MKKITLLLVFLLAFASRNYAQCIRIPQYPTTTVVSNNLGLPQQISTCNYTSEHAELSGIAIGSDYIFTCQLTGIDKYITITDLSDNVIASGDSPLTVTAISSSEIKVHFSDDAACGFTDSCHITTVQAVLTCPLPINSTIANITTTSADFSWELGGSETAWEVLVLTSGSTAPTSTTSGIAVTNLEYLATSLNSATSYQFYVRANCGSEFSPWSLPLNFNTACNAVTTLTENFDAATTFPVCWEKVGTTGTANVQASTGAASSPNVLYIFSGSATNQAVVALPSVSNAGAGTHRLKFKARANFTVGGVIEVGYLTDIADAATFVSLQTFTTTSTTIYDVFIAELGVDPLGYDHLAFRNLGTPANSILLDDVIWEPIPACPDVSGITSISTTTTTADIEWVAGGSETNWQYAIGATSVTDPNTLTPVGINTTTATISSLSPQTSYKVWVRSDCGTSYGVWVGPITVTTTCLPLSTLPWTENFDSLTTGTNIFPSCWAHTNTSSDWSIATFPTAYSGANSLRRTWSTDGWAYTPLATLTAGISYTLSYFMRTNDAVVGYDITVGVGNGQTESEMTDILSTVTGYQGPSWTKFSYEFIPTSNGDYSFGIHVTAPNPPNGINFDDFKLAVSPTCIEPSELVTTDVTVNSATVSWTESSTVPSNGYQYYLASDGIAPITSTTPTGSVTSGMTTTSLLGLTSATSYCVWVRSVCSLSDLSDWSSSTCFTTECAPETSNYTQDFNTDTFPSNCWTLNNEGDVSTGPTGTGTGIWFADSFLNVGTTNNSIKVNLYFTNRIGWIISPTFDLTGGNKTVSFDYGVTGWNLTTPLAMGTDDSVRLVMSEDDGATWSEISTFDASNNISNTLQSFSYDLTSTSSTTKFALLATDGTFDDPLDYDFFIDNFRVGASLAIQSFDNASFSYYPNPVKDILNLSYNKNISKVAVYNLIGQEVTTKSINANQSQIDMSNLSRGTYLVKVTADNQVKTIKVIKE